MQPSFATAADSLKEAREALRQWGVPFTKQKGGKLYIPGDLDISKKGLTKLPDLSRVIVAGDFVCSNNQLTSLEGAPTCIKAGFYCEDNQITSLNGAPTSVAGNFYCCHNQLASLEGGPRFVGGDYSCAANRLTTLHYSPEAVKGTFFCYENGLISLAGAPREFRDIDSDLGKYSSWDEIPGEKRVAVDTEPSVELKTPITVRRPLRLRM